MIKRNPIIYCCCFLVFACQNLAYKDKLSLILGIDKVGIESGNVIDDFGGFGEGKAIEVYVLSDETIVDFTQKSTKVLPDKQSWFKQNWTQNKQDSICKSIMDLSFNYRGGVELEKCLKSIEVSIFDPSTYISFYFNEKEPELSTQVELMVLDVKGKKMYVVETMM